MTPGDGIIVEAGGRVATVRMNRPEVRNALGPELMEELASRLESLDRDPDVRCMVVAGTDEVFASGADIRALAESSYEQALHRPAASFWRRLGEIRKPMVAAVSGWALGSGCELALACDLAVAAERTQFGQPEITLGIIPGGGATQRLARAAGKQRTMELILTGRRFNAEQAAAWGMINAIAPRKRWLETAQELAAEIAARAPIATRLAKQAVLAAERLPLDEGLAVERELFEQAMATEDRVEGMNALLEGRPPDFQDR